MALYDAIVLHRFGKKRIQPVSKIECWLSIL
jgi:hypothetical protein